MHVVIAIVSYRNVSDVVGCLAALANSEYQEFEVVICENGGPAAFEALVSQLPSQLPNGQPVGAILAPGNVGYAGGINRCIAERPHADAWWVLNPDTSPYPTALSKMVDRLGRGDCDAVGCTIHLPNGKVQSHGGRWRKSLARAVSIGHSTPLVPQPVPTEVERAQNYLNGASMLISRHFFEVAGPMRDEYFLYCEEVEWCLRASTKGLRLGYAPEALILHYQGTTTGNSTNIHARSRASVHLNERNRILLTRDLFPSRLPLVAVTTLLLMALRFGRKGAWRQLAYGVSGWADGLRNLRGMPEWMT